MNKQYTPAETPEKEVKMSKIEMIMDLFFTIIYMILNLLIIYRFEKIEPTQIIAITICMIFMYYLNMKIIHFPFPNQKHENDERSE